MTNELPTTPGRAEPGRILRALQQTAKADLPEFGAHRPPKHPLERDLGPGPQSNDREPGTSDEPTLEIERDGDHVRRITAVCTCGRKIDIHCDYDAEESLSDSEDVGGAPS